MEKQSSSVCVAEASPPARGLGVSVAQPNERRPKGGIAGTMPATASEWRLMERARTASESSRADGPRIVGVIGSRSLPLQYAEHVGAVVEDLLKRKNQIASGGAVGADEYCLAYLVHIGEADKGTVYSPWSTYEGFPVKVRVLTRQFKEYGGSIIWGSLRGQEDYAVVRAGLLQRNMSLIDAVTGCCCLFVWRQPWHVVHASQGTQCTLAGRHLLHRQTIT